MFELAHGPMLLLLDSDLCKSPLQNEGVRVFANFLYNIYIRLQIYSHFLIIFRNALICLGRQESEGNKTELTGGDKVLFS